MIELRDFKGSDLKALAQGANDPEVTRYLIDTFPSPYTTENAQWWLTTGCHQGINKAIVYQGKLVGGISLAVAENEQRMQGCVGYWLARSAWGKGVATEALKLFTGEIFASTDLVRLFACVLGPNIASMRVLEKNGFHREIILQKSAIKQGVLLDEHIFARFRQ